MSKTMTTPDATSPTPDALALARAKLERDALDVAMLEALAGADAGRQAAEQETAALRAAIATLTATRTKLEGEVATLEMRAAELTGLVAEQNRDHARLGDVLRNLNLQIGTAMADLARQDARDPAVEPVAS